MLSGCSGGPGDVDPTPVFTQITAGRYHTCGVTRAGEILCWGWNANGQVGDGSLENRLAPTRISSAERFVAVSAGFLHSCGLTTDGKVYCWGANGRGELGDGTSIERLVPVLVQTAQRFVAIGTGQAYTCGLTATGEIWCWGEAPVGPVGPSPAFVPARFAGPGFVSLTLGYELACARRPDETVCWGNNNRGQVGDGSTVPRAQPARVALAAPLVLVSAGVTHACGLSEVGAATCWGENAAGQLGDSIVDYSAYPLTAAVGIPLIDLSARSLAHTCGVTDHGDVVCWGGNIVGQLGDGTMQGSAVPIRVLVSARFTSVVTGHVHTCALTSEGAVWCWGYGRRGQLGDSLGRSSPTPVEVVRLPL